MREQILSGITAAVANAARTYGCADMSASTPLAQLSEAEQVVLADFILNSLACEPEGTAAPQPLSVPAQTVFTIDPAMVVARQARQSLNATMSDPAWQVNADVFMDTQTYAAEATENARETREFLFAVQEMFGCKVRCVRTNNDFLRRFIIAGNVAQRTALLETLDAFIEFSAPRLNSLSSTERSEFWATLGEMIAASDDAEVLIEDNRANYVTACAMMINLHGNARNLTRIPAATDGPVYDLAASAVNQPS